MVETVHLADVVKEQSSHISRLEDTNTKLVNDVAEMKKMMVQMASTLQSVLTGSAQPSAIPLPPSVVSPLPSQPSSSSPSPPPSTSPPVGAPGVAAPAAAAAAAPHPPFKLQEPPTFAECKTLTDVVNVWWGKGYHDAETAHSTRSRDESSHTS